MSSINSQELSAALQGDSKTRVESLQKALRRLGLETKIHPISIFPNLFLLWILWTLLEFMATYFLFHFQPIPSGILALLGYLGLRFTLQGQFPLEPILPLRTGYNLQAVLKGERADNKKEMVLFAHHDPGRSFLSPFPSLAFKLFYSSHWVVLLCAILTYALPSWIWPYAALASSIYLLLIMILVGIRDFKRSSFVSQRSSISVVLDLAEYFSANKPQGIDLHLWFTDGGESGGRGIREVFKFYDLKSHESDLIWIQIEDFAKEPTLIAEQGIPRPVPSFDLSMIQEILKEPNLRQIRSEKYRSVPLESYVLASRSIPTLVLSGFNDTALAATFLRKLTEVWDQN
ncbi:MAG: hypothetical protein HY538_07085 [Deltaproteobacteria bacterium]|nr:hypothetical protein [Deltaproteobacteria bacterium]